MKITDAKIDTKQTLGTEYLLTEVHPIYVYANGQRTDQVSGYRYTLILPQRKLDRIDCRIDGPQQLDAPDTYIPVTLDGLEVSIYWSRRDYALTAKAAGIKAVTVATK